MIQKYYTLDNRISDAKWRLLWNRPRRLFDVIPHTGKRRYGRHWIGKTPKNGRARIMAYLHDFSQSQKYLDEEDNLIYHWKPRGKVAVVGSWISDWDWPDYRGRRSTGWKDHKRRRQWEHRLREQEKHRRNRERKAVHRRGYLTENESDSE